MAGTRSRAIYEAAARMARRWRQRAHMVMFFAVVFPRLRRPVLALLLWLWRRCAEQVDVMRARTLLVSCEGGRVWDMDTMAEKWQTDANMEQNFRFDEIGLRTLEGELGMPETIKLGPQDGSWFKEVTRTEVLLITLERMHRCTTYFDLGNKYGLQTSVIGNAVNYGLEHLEHQFKAALADVRRWVHYVPGWAAAVDAKTRGVLTPVWGFIDVLIQRICKISNIMVVGGQLNPQALLLLRIQGHFLNS